MARKPRPEANVRFRCRAVKDGVERKTRDTAFDKSGQQCSGNILCDVFLNARGFFRPKIRRDQHEQLRSKLRGIGTLL